MELFIDHDVYKTTVDFLRHHGHDVVTAKEINKGFKDKFLRG